MKQIDWFTVRQIYPCIFSLAEFHHFEKVVSYLLVGKHEAALFDTGMGYANIRAVVNKITPLPITVFLTHAHWDHIGGMNSFKNISILNNPFECKQIKKGFHSSEISELCQHSLFDKPFLPKKFDVLGIKNFETFDNGQTLRFDSFDINIIHTPGHTPGSTCFLINNLGILISGDNLYSGPIYLQLTESNFLSYAQSIKHLMRIKSSIKFILPGHNTVIEDKGLLTSANSLCHKIRHNAITPNTFTNWDEYKEDRLSILLPAS